jgi:hypothetical protein
MIDFPSFAADGRPDSGGDERPGGGGGGGRPVTAISIVAFVLYRWIDWFTGNPAPNDSATWVNAAIAGAFGALVSALSRTKDLGLEPAARNPGLAVEAFARALIGAAAGLLVNFAFEGGLLVKDALATTTRSGTPSGSSSA